MFELIGLTGGIMGMDKLFIIMKEEERKRKPILAKRGRDQFKKKNRRIS